jgi:hypothetical protein
VHTQPSQKSFYLIKAEALKWIEEARLLVNRDQRCCLLLLLQLLVVVVVMVLPVLLLLMKLFYGSRCSRLAS